MSRLQDDLLDPAAFHQQRPGSVELRETHISWVFLLERDVFKIKKPVDFGFLDFRTLEQRQAACEAEVRLNARLSPQVYLGVVPVRRGLNGRHAIGGEEEIVEWAVHMVRLPDELRADQKLAHHELSGPMVDAIAERIAEFHVTARCDTETARFGTPEAIALNVEENFSQTRRTIDRYLSASESSEIIAWQTAFLRDRRSAFEKRIQLARVRDGHGDLRLEHVYFGDRGIAILDCIEFSDRFRFADVCADVAFLSMDLVEHGRVDLAERLLARYAREANDFDLYELVDFYESYRAFVRGKIAAIVADDLENPEPSRLRAARESRRYFLLALSAHRRALLRPVVVAVGGIIASGKSTIAERIAAEMSAPVIEADRTRKALLGVAPQHPMHDPAWQGAYDPAFTEQVYAEVLRRARVVLASGRPVVLDASFRSEATRNAARALAEEHGVAFRFVECRASAAACRARLTERTGAVSDGRLEIFDAFVASFEPVTEIAAVEHVVIDTMRPIDESMTELRARLDTWPTGFVA